MITLDALLSDESLRQQEFPVIKDSLFLAHAGVTILPRRVTRTMQDYLEQCCLRMQEYPEAWKAVNETRFAAAELIGAKQVIPGGGFGHGSEVVGGRVVRRDPLGRKTGHGHDNDQDQPERAQRLPLAEPPGGLPQGSLR